MAILSIVVPVYNTKDYLKKCIESILNQTYKDIELILVDDGSTDGSADVCKKYAQEDNRVKYIYQENAGEIASRKKGADIAQGEFIAFVDSDDYIDEDYYEKMMEIELKYNVDLVESGYWHLESNEHHGSLETGLYDTKVKMDYLKSNLLYYKNTSNAGLTECNWTKLFKRNKLCSVFEEFNKYKKRINYAGDKIISLMYILQCNSVYISDICCYRYIKRNTSVSHIVHKNYLQTISDYYNILFSAFSCDEQKNILINQLEQNIKELIMRAPRLMGFNKENQFVMYNCSLIQKGNKRIALYGAGDIGRNYYLGMKKNEQQPVIWVDSNYSNIDEEFNIKSPYELKNIEFDYVLIAVKYKSIADEIKANLINMGIPEEKIFWEEPIRIKY